ncbi:MAG TPA: hypothetical protein VGH85_20515 [Mycobacteriales bacterium]
MRRTAGSRGHRWPALAVLVATVWWLSAPGAWAAPHGDGAGDLRVLTVDRSRLPGVTAIAVAPDMLSELSLPAGSFSARRGDRRLPTTAVRLADGHLEVVLVLNRAVSAAALSEEQAAAAELVHSLPAGVPVHVYDDATATIRPTGRAEAEAAIAGTTRFSASPMDGGLTSVALTRPATARREFVVLTACPRDDPASDDQQLANALSVAGQQLDVIGAGTGCGAGLAAVARGTGGSLVTGKSPGEVAAAVDRVAHGLLAEYEVSFRLPAGAVPSVTLAVSAQNVRAEEAIRIAGPPAPPPHDLSDTATIAIGAGVSVGLLGLTVLLVAIDRRRTAAV